jgi:hypothetical protein
MEFPGVCPTPLLWQFTYGYLRYSVRPTDDRRFDPTRPHYILIPDGGPYVELSDWTEGLESRPKVVMQVKANEEVTTEAAKFIVAGHYL